MIPLQTANHRYLNMNVKKKPFNDPRVRQAIALALDRPGIAQGLWGKYAQVGNDSPMWPGYAFTDKSVAQRHKDIAKAKALLKAADATNLKLTLTCYRSFEMPDYAQRVAAGPQADRHHVLGQGVHERRSTSTASASAPAGSSPRGSPPTSGSSTTGTGRCR